MNKQSRPLIIGIGNRFRSDDAVGIVVAQGVADRLGGKVDVLLHRSDPAYLLDVWQQRELVIAADAVNEDQQPPGKIYFWDALRSDIPASELLISTHSLGLASAVELAKSLQQLPENLWLCGINCQQFDMGERLSAEVAAGAELLIESLIQRLNHYLDGRTTEEKENA